MKYVTSQRVSVRNLCSIGAKVIVIVIILLYTTNSFAQTLRTSIQTGNWNNRNTWDCDCVPSANDDVTIQSGHTVTFVSNGNQVRNLTINAGGVLSDNGNTNAISGNLTVHGNYSGTGPVTLSGSGAIIDGTGIISSTNIFTIVGNKTIAATANITKNIGNISINGPYIITNHGTITLGGVITAAAGAAASGATWTNAENSTLNIGGAGNAILSGGSRILNASATGNTVNYFGAASQNIKVPSASTYYHLRISGTLGAVVTGNLIVAGNLTISSSTLNATSFQISVRGNWVNTGVFSASTSTVVLDGADDQAITVSNTETFYNLTVNKAAGNVSANADIVVSNTLTMSSSNGGHIALGPKKITLGTDVTEPGALAYSGSSRIIGRFERFINATGSYYFPIGTGLYGREVLVTINTLVTGGSLVAEFSSIYPGNSGLPASESGVEVRNTFRDGFWSLATANSLSASGYDLEVTANGFTGFPAITADTRLLSRSTSASPWTLNGTHGVNSGNTVKRNLMTLLPAQYALGDNSVCDAPVTGVLSGNTQVCRNDAGSIYSVAGTSGNTFNWVVVGGSITGGQGTSSISVTWGMSQ